MQPSNSQQIRQNTTHEGGLFVRVPIDIHESMMRMTAGEIKVLLVLLRHADRHTRQCTLKTTTICTESFLSRTQIFEILKRLESGLHIARFGEHGGHANTYKVLQQPSGAADGNRPVDRTVRSTEPSGGPDCNRPVLTVEPSGGPDPDTSIEQKQITDKEEQIESSASTAKPQTLKVERLENETTTAEKPVSENVNLHLSETALPGLDIPASVPSAKATEPKVKNIKTTKPIDPDGQIELPEALKPVEADIRDWLRFKRERGQGYKPTGFSRLTNSLLAMETPERMRAALNHSMACNYAGVFEPKNGNGQTHSANHVPDFVKHPNWSPADPTPSTMSYKELRWHMKQLG